VLLAATSRTDAQVLDLSSEARAKEEEGARARDAG
jgi:hypothetical protein